MVQPYLGAVDEVGETALLFVGGEFVHTLRKRAVLRADEVAPMRDDALGAAEAMYDPELVVAGESTEAEREVAAADRSTMSPSGSAPRRCTRGSTSSGARPASRS